MAGLDRRSFLRGTALAGAAAATTAARPGGGGQGADCGPPPDFSIPPSTLPTDPADNPIDHIGVLMMENRSFDTYFGWLEASRGFLELGLELQYADPDDPSVVARPEHWAPEYRRCGHPDPGHSWGAGRGQLRDGFLAGRNDEYALAYYLPEDIQIFARLARQFTVLDGYHCAVLGPTYPNRFYQHAATSMGMKSNLFPHEAGSPTGFEFPTIWDRLEAAGISWAYYYSDLPFIAMWGERLLHNMRPIGQYYGDAATGNLPQVFFVEPKFIAPYRTDDHPGGSDVRAAQAYVNNIVKAFVASSHWERGAFFINYDEWGGFFDHVTPPRVPDDRASDDLDEDFGQLGFRVPCLAISPYSRKGFVHHGTPFEHTSILRFIEYRFDLEPLTVRDAHATNIGEVFDYTQSRRLDVGMDELATPTVYDSEDCNQTGDEEDPDDFVRFAASGYLASLGTGVHEPAPAELFGTGVDLPQPTPAALTG